ncbi:MAG: hypothetical protein JNK79_01595 [Chitinophagaceae bacterium]|nr:hypothetical protein [Chitinophagaceae bacterium]
MSAHFIMKLQYHFILSILLIAGIACGDNNSSSKKRPKDIWVFRSVLDRQPRMLTIALDTNCYVAYDVARCKISKAWKGGVTLQGAAYTNQPNLQPVSWGDVYTDKLATEWNVLINGKTDSFHLLNKGYRFNERRVYLKFGIVLSSGDTVYVEESPEVVSKENTIGLERKFMLSGVPKDVIISIGDYNLKSDEATTLITWFTSPLQANSNSHNISDHIGKFYMDKSDCFTCHETDRQNVGPSFQQVARRYKNEKDAIDKLIGKVKDGGTGQWGANVMTPHTSLSAQEIRYMLEYILSLESSGEEIIEEEAPVVDKNAFPGDRAPLAGVHPSFDLQTIHDVHFTPRVGGMAFMPGGRLVVTTWDSIGGVYLLDGVETGDTNKITVKRIAAGLAEPLGVEVVNGEIYVLQKHELTRLIDHDGDGVTDEYATVCNAWGATADFHEFAFGLQYRDGYFYATLSMAMRLLSTEKQLPDRGTVIKIARDGRYEKVIYGLRQPNGIGLGPGDEIFITDNQGQWLPASKLIHVKQGEYHGMRWGHLDTLTEPPPMAMPAIWMPENEAANSPSEPVLVRDGIYKGQMLHGDVTAGGIQRDFLEKINGEYQGCLFRFTQGLETGVNRLCFGPDGCLYIGGLGLVGGWSYRGRQFGLQKMRYNSKPVFEMLAIRAKPKGFEIELTEELASLKDVNAHNITIEQWRYKPTADYGGPKVDVEKLVIRKIMVSPDRKKINLEIDNLKERHVVYFRLPRIKSARGNQLWSTESWYTLNNIPR